MRVDQSEGSVQDQSISCFSASPTSRRLAANHPWRCPRLHVIEELWHVKRGSC
jgi:hypothetical protein